MQPPGRRPKVSENVCDLVGSLSCFLDFYLHGDELSVANILHRVRSQRLLPKRCVGLGEFGKLACIERNFALGDHDVRSNSNSK